jgi:2'-5' RNA ligase
MQGIVSIVESNLKKEIEKIWDEISEKFNINPLKPTLPHFSWIVAEKFDPELVENSIVPLIEKMKKFLITINGLASFSGPDTIFYLPIQVTEELLNIHKMIWQIINSLIKNIKNLNDYYLPDNWIPHLTVFHQKETHQLGKQIFEMLKPLIGTYTIEISNISLIDNESKVYFRHDF